MRQMTLHIKNVPERLRSQVWDLLNTAYNQINDLPNTKLCVELADKK